MATAVVTGSYSGIGRAVRGQLEAEGDRVIGIDIREAEIVADLSTPEGREEAVEQALERSAGEIDKLVVAAGLGGGKDGTGLTVLNLNYYGSVEIMDALKPAMIGRPNPSVVAISSNSSQFGVDYQDPTVLALLEGDVAKSNEAFGDQDSGAAYRLSKHAVVRAVRRRAVAWGPDGVRINAVVPGQTQTPLFQRVMDDPLMSQFVGMIPLPIGRVADPKEVANVVCFALSDKASYVHGSVLWVDGGTDAGVRPDLF
jgi:3alpha-hydroxysteroid 3-dehydrogenase